MMELISTQIVVSYLLVALGELLKRLPFVPWMTAGATRANRVMAAVMAAAQTVGISATFDTNAGELVISGLTLVGIASAAVEFGRAWVAQRLLYILAFRPAR